MVRDVENQAANERTTPLTNGQLASGAARDEDEDEDNQGKYLCDMPMRFLKNRKPTLYSLLETTGYDQALRVQDCTHLCIYLSCFVTFVFSAMWLVDVFSWNCALQRGDHDIAGDNIFDSWRCVFELAGGLIFAGCLRDSIVMLGNYDNEHKLLLTRKEKLMAELHTGIVEALRKAKDNADKLYTMLFGVYETQAGGSIGDIFDCVLPILCQEFHGRDRSLQDQALLKRLAQLLKANFAEVGQLSAAACKKLPAVFENFKMYCPTINIEACSHLLDKENAETPVFWIVLMNSPEVLSLRDAEIPDSVSNAEEEDIKSHPERYVFAPVKKMVVLLEDLLKSSASLATPSVSDSVAIETLDQLMGFGDPPWSGAEENRTSLFSCCMPRIVRFVFLRICCFCCCCSGACSGATKYPKKVRLGFVWFAIMSKLHERLIQGLIFSVFFLSIYAWKVFLIIRLGCNSNALSSSWWSCVAMELKRCSLLLALIFHIPAAILCLVRIRDLDAVMRIMEDIRKLQGIRGIIQDFSRTLELDGERQALLDAVKDRVLMRMNIVHTFKTHINSIRDQNKGEPEEMKVHLREAMGVLVDYLEFAALKLSSPSQWLKLAPEKQKEQVQEVEAVAKLVVERNFRPGAVPGRIFSASSRSSSEVSLPQARSPRLTAPLVPTRKAARPDPNTPPMTPRTRQLTPPMTPRTSDKVGAGD